MRLILVALVFTFHAARCGDSGNTSANSKLQNGEKTLRNKPELHDARLEDSKNSLAAAPLARKDFLTEILKRRCNACMESLKCKQLGKCDHCVRICKEYDPTMFPAETQAPLLGSVQPKEPQPVTLRSRNNADNLLNPLGSSWYYTVDSFGANSKQNLLVRLLNIARKDKLEKLVVLAKAKEAIDGEGPGNSVIADSVNVFKRNVSTNDITAEVHTVDGSKVPHAVDLELASKIDDELSKAMTVKKKTTGQPYLTTQEIDKIIDQALAMFNYKVMSSNIQPTAPDDNVLLSSRMNIPETFSSTTKRSISVWKSFRNTDNLLRRPLAQLQQFKLNPNLQKPTNNINRNARIPAPDNLPMNKKTITKPYNQSPTNKSPTADGEDDNDDDNGESSSLSEEDTMEGDDDSNDDADEDKDLPVYDIEPPSNYMKENQDARNTQQGYASPPMVRVTNKTPRSPRVLNIPINQTEKPQSANQYVEQPTKILNSYENNEDDDDDNDENFSNERLSLAAPQLSDKSSESDETAVVENAKNASRDASSPNFTGPLLGRNWVEDEWDKAKNWWHTNVGLETPQNWKNNSDLEEQRNLQTSENVQMEESQVDSINASYFTLILKNLERKVENIADLVKKTCGHSPREETVGQRDPLYSVSNLEDSTKNDTDTSQKVLIPIPSRKNIRIIETPDPETATTSTQTEETATSRFSPHILNKAINRLDKDADFLINRAKDFTKSLQENLTPKPAILGSYKKHEQDSDSPIARNKENPNKYVGDSRINCENAACSKEDSDELVSDRSQNQRKDTSKKNKDKSCIEEYVEKSDVDEDQSKQRSTVFQEGTDLSAATDKSPQEDIVEYSKEETEKYVGAQKEDKTFELTTANNVEEVGCSKEEEEENIPVNTGYRKSEANSISSSSETPKLKPLVNLPPLNNLLHESRPTHHHKEESYPSEKHASHDLPLFDEEGERTHSNMPKIYAPSHKFVTETSVSYQESKIPQKIIDPHTPELQDEGVSPQAARGQHQQFHITMPNPPLDESRILPSSALDQEYNSHLMPPSLSQRFSDHKFMGDEFQETIPQSARSWTSRQGQNDVVGSEKGEETDNLEPGVATPPKDSYTPNPFSIFGKVVPQLNNTEIPFHHIPSNKIYFVGTGMQLPLNMKKHEDGSYQLSVDVDKLCSNCNENSCKSMIDETVGAVKKEESAEKSLNERGEDANTDVTNKEDNDLETHSGEKLSEHKTPRYKPDIHKIEILSTDTPKVRNKRIPSGQPPNNIGDKISEETRAEPSAFNNEEFQHHSFFGSNTDNRRHRRSDISKRSPKLDSVFPILQRSANMDEHENSDYKKRTLVRTNSLSSLNETWKRINQNLKRYHAKRAQANERQQNKSEIDSPNGKREIKKGFVVVNDILNWMKNIASKNTKA